jgi:hypothetical protein
MVPGATVIRGAGTQHWNHACGMCASLAERVETVPTRLRRERRRDAPAVTLSKELSKASRTAAGNIERAQLGDPLSSLADKQVGGF